MILLKCIGKAVLKVGLNALVGGAPLGDRGERGTHPRGQGARAGRGPHRAGRPVKFLRTVLYLSAVAHITGGLALLLAPGAAIGAAQERQRLSRVVSSQRRRTTGVGAPRQLAD